MKNSNLKDVKVPTESAVYFANITVLNDNVPFLEKLRRCICVFRGHNWTIDPERIFYYSNEELENTIADRIQCKCCGIKLSAAPKTEYVHPRHKNYLPGFYKIPEDVKKSGVIKTEK